MLDFYPGLPRIKLHTTHSITLACECVVSFPARTCLLARNALVNEVEFLGLIPQKW